MQPELKVRRARRDDLARVRALLGEHQPADRADRKRFRRLVSTLREDLYLAERAGDEPLDGLAVIVYVRGLGPTTAIVRSLRGSAEAATLLLECARERALARGCARLEVHLDPAAPDMNRDRWQDGPHVLQRAVTA
jgi:ribosomal protein S18 acetylase RimI-like enzyme